MERTAKPQNQTQTQTQTQSGGFLKGSLMKSSFQALQGLGAGPVEGIFSGTGFQRKAEGTTDRYTLHLDLEMYGEKITLKGSQEIWDEVDKNGFGALKGRKMLGDVVEFNDGSTNNDGSARVYFAADSMKIG